MLAGDYLVALNDVGELAIVEASPARYQELTRAALSTRGGQKQSISQYLTISPTYTR